MIRTPRPGPVVNRRDSDLLSGSRTAIRLLLVEDDPSDADLTLERLDEAGGPRFQVTHETRLSSALDRLAEGGTDVVLLDLDLPDSRGIATCERVLEAHPGVPVVVLTGTEDSQIGVRAVQRGAQDFLSKDHLDPDALARAIRYAVERHALVASAEIASREAKESAARLRNLIGRSPEGFLVVDQGRSVRFVNPAAGTLLGIPPEDLLGCTLTLPLPSGDAREVTVPRADGTCFPAEMRVAALEWEGGPAWLVSLHDLSDRKRAERVAIAQAVQRAFLPERQRLVKGDLLLSGRNELCEDASGDYYDFVELPDGRVVVAIGDVTGHGLGPAMLMAQGRAFLRAFCRTMTDAARVMAELNEALAADMTSGRFMTMFLAFVEPGTGRMTWCNAGHVPPLLRRAGSAEVERLEPSGPVLGIKRDVQFGVREEERLEPGDVLFLCSDGATEASRPDGERFGFERVIEVLRAQADEDPDELLDSMRSSLHRWTDGRPLQDDLTMVAVQRDRAAVPRRRVAPGRAGLR
jgi:DNA-binding NarL/FixJ family response regulator